MKNIEIPVKEITSDKYASAAVIHACADTNKTAPCAIVELLRRYGKNMMFEKKSLSKPTPTKTEV
ncbi:MAG: hypothetical protein RR506_08535 [Akkermansia sp.]